MTNFSSFYTNERIGPEPWRAALDESEPICYAKKTKIDGKKEFPMQIDGNELAIQQNELDRQGFKEEALKIKREFLKQVREAGDHCPCKEACPHHGNCFECVTVHRGHRDHLPLCMWDMVNERIAALSHMTEGSLRAYEDRKAAEAASACDSCEGCAGCKE